MAAMPGQYSGFGGSEEWRFQGAFKGMAVKTAPDGKYCAFIKQKIFTWVIG
jgi:hypothetical protein